MYCGAAGVLWALADLRERGHAETSLDLARSRSARPRASPCAARPPEVGEPSRASGFVAPQWGGRDPAHRVSACAKFRPCRRRFTDASARTSTTRPTRSCGVPPERSSRRVACSAVTQELRWREAWDESAAALLARRDADGLWTQKLYGHADRILGPVHGLVGNVLALGRGLDPRRRAALYRASKPSRAYRCHRESPRKLAAVDGRVARAQDGNHPRPVVPWGTGSGRIGGRLPRRGAPRRRGRAHVAGRCASRRAGLVALPRDGGERLRAPEAFAGRATSAGSSALAASRFMPWRRCAGNGRAGPGPVLAVDGRPRRGALPCRLPRCAWLLPVLDA